MIEIIEEPITKLTDTEYRYWLAMALFVVAAMLAIASFYLGYLVGHH